MTTALTIDRGRIYGTDTVYYSAWEPYDGHSTQKTIDGVSMGRVGTRRLSETLDALQALSSERLAAVGFWHETQYEEAYAAIVNEYPSLGMNGGLNSKRDMGEIRTTEPE